MNRFLLLAPVLGSVGLAGCATVASLPESPEDVVLDPDRFEQGYWPRYTASTTLHAVSKERALAAARTALRESGFKIVRDDPDRLVIAGEHGPTAFYWNVVAGIYIAQKIDGDIEVKVVSVGSKDVGFIELQRNPFPKQLVQGVERAVQAR